MAKPLSYELSVKIQTPESIVWEGTAAAVSSRNARGAFDVLPDHANMVTLVEGSPIQVVTSEGDKSFTFAKAVISVHENSIIIFADIQSDGSAATDSKGMA